VTIGQDFEYLREVIVGPGESAALSRIEANRNELAHALIDSELVQVRVERQRDALRAALERIAADRCGACGEHDGPDDDLICVHDIARQALKELEEK